MLHSLRHALLYSAHQQSKELSSIIHKILQTESKQSHASTNFYFKNFSWWFLVPSTLLIKVRDETYPRHSISSRHETVNSSAHAKVLIRLNNKKLQSSTFTRFCCCGFPLLRAIHLLMLTCNTVKLAHVWGAYNSEPEQERAQMNTAERSGSSRARINCAHTRTTRARTSALPSAPSFRKHFQNADYRRASRSLQFAIRHLIIYPLVRFWQLF